VLLSQLDVNSLNSYEDIKHAICKYGLATEQLPPEKEDMFWSKLDSIVKEQYDNGVDLEIDDYEEDNNALFNDKDVKDDKDIEEEDIEEVEDIEDI
jgi:hypothetical protein